MAVMSDEQLAEAIEREMVERERVSKLTNEQLADELLQQLPFTEFDSIIEEAATRIDPTWEKRANDAPLTAADERVLAKAMDHFNKRMDEIDAKRAALETGSEHGSVFGTTLHGICDQCRATCHCLARRDEKFLCPECL